MEKNQKILLLIAWFVISYLILWFFGGACTALFSSTTDVCLAKPALNGLTNIPIINLFLPYAEWVSLFYWFAPIAGFVFAYFGIKWYNNYFNTQEASGWIFPMLVMVLLLVGFGINLFIYYNEGVMLRSNRNPNVEYNIALCFENNSASCNETYQKINNELAQQKPPVKQYFVIDYWKELRENILLTFSFGMIAAWVFLFGINLYEKRKESN